MHHITDEAINIIKKFHPFSPEPYIATDLGAWAIGYGHRRTVRAGMKITESQADILLRDDMAFHGNYVKKIIKVPLNENQYSALVVFLAHVGPYHFERTDFVIRLNRGWYEQVPASLIRFSRRGTLVQKLHRRSEAELWKKPVEEGIILGEQHAESSMHMVR